MSEPNSASDQTPEVPKAPSFTYGEAAPPPAPAPAPSSPLPPPTYGERTPDYAAAPAYGTPAPGQQPYGHPAPRRRTWDLVLTVILLVIGLVGAAIGIIYGVIFMNPELLAIGLEQQGLDPTVGDTSGAGILIVVSHVLLYLIALGLGILLLVKRKIAFYVPLAAGVIAAVIFVAALVAVSTEIPGLMSGTF